MVVKPPSIIAPPRTGDEREMREWYEQMAWLVSDHSAIIEAALPEVNNSGLPDSPINFTATGAYASIILQWNLPTYKGHSYTEVWRNTTNNLGTASYVGKTDASIYTDIPPNLSTSVVYYYWIRHVSVLMELGSYSLGMPVSTSSDATYVLQVLLTKIGFQHMLPGTYPVRTVNPLPNLPDNNYPEGCLVFLTTDGKVYRNYQQIWKRHIESDDLAANAVIAGKIAAGAIVADDGVISNAAIKTAHIQDAAITNIKVANLAVDSAKIADAAITTAKIANAAVDNAKIGNVIQASALAADGQPNWKIDKTGSIDARNLTVRDTNGNILLSSGGGVVVPFGVSNNTLTNALPHAAVTGLNVVPTDWICNHDGAFTQGVDYFAGVNQYGTERYIPGEFTPSIYQNNNVTTGNQRFYLTKNGSTYPVDDTKKYEFSVYSGTHRCKAWLVVYWYDSAGNFLAQSPGAIENNNEKAGGKTLSDYKRIGGFFTPPVGARSCYPHIFKGATLSGSNDSYLFVTRAYFGEARADQTTFSPWSPGLHAGGPITASNVSTFIANAAIGNAQIGNASIGTAQIQDAAVQTLQIGQDQVTVNVASYGPGPYTMGISWTDIASTVIDTAGQPLSVIIQGSYSVTSSVVDVSRAFMVRIVDVSEASTMITGGSYTGIYSQEAYQCVPSKGHFTIIRRFGAKSGARTVKLQAYKTSSYDTWTLSDVNFVLMGVKR